jgi:hypothetical protein
VEAAADGEDLAPLHSHQLAFQAQVGGLPLIDCVSPSSSSKMAAMKPPWTQPGGPSYAVPKRTLPTMRPSSGDSSMGGAMGWAAPMNGLWSKKARGEGALAGSAKPS